MLVISVDFETWNEDPITSGIYAYLRRLRILMMAWHRSDDPGPPQLWLPGMPFPEPIRQGLAQGARLAGWNSIQFERLVWRDVAIRDHGFPPVEDDIWLDSMHLAAAANLPRSLEGAAKAVGAIAQKDSSGHTLMLRVTNGNRTPWPPKPEDIERLGQYCIQDVAAEEATAARLPAWPSVQPWLAMPAIDRRINDRGVMVDLPLVRGLARAAAIETTRLDGEMAKLTDGEVPKTTNIESLKKWLIARNVELPRNVIEDEDDEEDGEEDETPTKTGTKSPWRLRKSDIADLLARTDVPEDCRLALSMRMEAAKASTRKLRVMLNSAGMDWRLRGALILMGAQSTGRWCLAEDSMVAVRDVDGCVSEKPIQDVTIFDEVWDGDFWVKHEGVVFSGEKEVIEHDGIVATPEHIVYVSDSCRTTLLDAAKKKLNLFRGLTYLQKHTQSTE